MKNYLTAKRRITIKAFRLALAIVALTPVLLSSQPALAQGEEYGLTLSLRDAQYNYNVEARSGLDNRLFLEVRNIGIKTVSNISLSAEVPQGWSIEFQPVIINSLSSGGIATVDIDITPIDRVTGGKYFVTFTAEANEIRKVQSFPVTIAPELELTLSLLNSRRVYDYNHEARAGQDNKFFLEVKNTGTKPADNIRLSAENESWTIEFNPSVINYLGAGGIETVVVNIRPVGKATIERHQVTFIAESNEARKIEIFWINVKPAQSWVWIWSGVGILIVAGFVFVYMRFGRQ